MNFEQDKKEEMRLMRFLGAEVERLFDYSENEWREYEKEKAKIWQKLREEVFWQTAKRMGGEFEAPSFDFSVWSEAGERRGKVTSNIDDYTRDQHPLARKLEKELASVYQPKNIEALVTCSGMGALTTIRLALQRMGVMKKIAIGRECYFQNREQFVGQEIEVFDETNLEEVRRLLAKGVRVFLVDTMSNTEKLVVVEVEKIMATMKKWARERVFLVVDNSLLGAGVDYGKLWKMAKGKVELIVWESLNKFFQYGLDRTMGGVIWSRGKMAGELFEARMHAGTIMPYWACAMMPRQNKTMMKWYQMRIERNRKILEAMLPSAKVALRDGFAGAQIVWPMKSASPWKIKLLVWRCLREARKRRVQLVGGSSFGLPTTRIYLTARKTSFARMFLRISVGWECECAIREVGRVLAKVLVGGGV